MEALCVEEGLPYHSRESSLCVRAPSFIRLVVVLMLSDNSIFFLADGYLYKGPSEEASSAERSAKAAKAYKAKVTSLISEKAEVRARIQSLTEDVMTHKSDLKHTSTSKASAEDREKKSKEGLRVV